jgi:hypothetical protein
LITESYQRPLRWRERIALRLHLTVCDACTNFKKQMRLLTDAARRFNERVTAEFGGLRLSEEARRRITAALAAEPPD